LIRLSSELTGASAIVFVASALHMRLELGIKLHEVSLQLGVAGGEIVERRG
jgi:hypothetical protein